jgi:hypothetical protein
MSDALYAIADAIENLADTIFVVGLLFLFLKNMGGQK